MAHAHIPLKLLINMLSKYSYRIRSGLSWTENIPKRKKMETNKQTNNKPISRVEERVAKGKQGKKEKTKGVKETERPRVTPES